MAAEEEQAAAREASPVTAGGIPVPGGADADTRAAYWAAVRRVAATRPPLTPGQRRRLRPILSGHAGDEADERAGKIRRIVDEAPPFTEEQRRRLRPILAAPAPPAATT